MKQRKLSTGQPRSALIASYAAAVPPPAPEKTPPPPADDKAPPEPDAKPEGPDLDADVDVTKAIDAAIKAQEADPDKADPNDEKVLKLLNEAKAAQAADTEDTAKESAAPPEKVPPPAKAPPAEVKTAATQAPVVVPPATADKPANPVDENGNVDDEHPCTRPDCGHLASAHEDLPAGDNTGKCTMGGCHCPAMEVASEQDEPESEDASDMEAPAGAGDDEQKTAIGQPVPVAPIDDAAAQEQNPPPPVESGEAIGPAFTAVLIIEGQPTGDGREISPQALTWRTPPIPLMFLKTETHDPEGFDMNDPAVIGGNITSVTREQGEGDTQLLIGKGNLLTTEDGIYAAEVIEGMGRMGISADVSVGDVDISVGDVDEIGFPTDITETLTTGTLMGATVCPFPAFEGCYIVLGDELPGAEPKQIEQAVEAPEQITAGGMLIHWMSETECEPCQQGFEVITASGAGPTRPPAAWFADPGFTEDDGRLVEILGKHGQREDKYACPITVDDDGRVYGHLAAWGTCHSGKPGRCVTAPHSASDYAHFKHGYVITAEGEKIRVGSITADTGHANLQFGPYAAMGHYDNTGYQVADVNAGEDAYGIWLAGAVRPDATEEQLRKLIASSQSGDWREIAGQLELVASLCVPLPGFPLAVVEEAFVAHGQLETVTAAGANVMARLKMPAEPVEVDLLKLAAPTLTRLVREDARERIGALG